MSDAPPAPSPDDPSGSSGGWEPIPEPVECWRCGKRVAPAPRCPYCRARLGPDVETGPEGPRPARAQIETDAGTAATRIVVAYVGLLAVSLGFGWTQRFGLRDEARPAAGGDGCDLGPILALEAVDIALTLAALFWVRPRFAAPPISPARRAAAWAAGVPLLALALGINLGYNRLLRDMLHVPMLDSAILGQCGWSATLIVALCLQPAIFEELFFRHVVLDTFRGPAGVHTAVIASSAMFGFAHIGTPLSIPALTVLGLAMGYARVLSGSLLLPMLMHFVHNAAVLYLAGIG